MIPQPSWREEIRSWQALRKRFWGRWEGKWLSITEGGKEERNKVMSSCSYLEEKFQERSKRERRSGACNQRWNIGSGLENENEAVGSKGVGKQRSGRAGRSAMWGSHSPEGTASFRKTTWGLVSGAEDGPGPCESVGRPSSWHLAHRESAVEAADCGSSRQVRACMEENDLEVEQDLCRWGREQQKAWRKQIFEVQTGRLGHQVAAVAHIKQQEGQMLDRDAAGWKVQGEGETSQGKSAVSSLLRIATAVLEEESCCCVSIPHLYTAHLTHSVVSCRFMSTCLSTAVPTTWRRNRDLCVSLLLCACLFLRSTCKLCVPHPSLLCSAVVFQGTRARLFCCEVSGLLFVVITGFYNFFLSEDGLRLVIWTTESWHVLPPSNSHMQNWP